MSRTSFERLGPPSAILTNGATIVPLWSVSSISLTESYHLPPVGVGADRVLIDSHDDRISMTGVLPGPQRFIWKEMLELLAELTIAKNPVQEIARLDIGGIVLWTTMTLRTDIYIESLSFSASAQKRKALDVSLTLVHLPRPSRLPLLLDLGNVALSSAIDPFVGG